MGYSFSSMEHSEGLRNSHLYRTIERRRYGASTCFLCGCRLGKKNRADEHVVPKWVQERFGLWNQELVLLNGTSIPYRQLVIPCCASCNNEHLSRLENAVRKAVEVGAEAVRALPKVMIFQWLSKIFYGLMYKELFLRRDRRTRASTTIVSRQMLDRFRLHHFFLQSVRLPIDFHGGFPASIFIHNVQCPSDVRRQFNFRDLHHFLGLSVRLGAVGIVGILQDAGTQAELLAGAHSNYYAHELHPLQFAELTAKTFYKATLMNRTPKYTIAETSGRLTVLQMPIAGLSSRPLYNDWSQEHYAWVLSEHTMQSREMLNCDSDRMWTWLHREDGSFLDLDVERNPWP